MGDSWRDLICTTDGHLYRLQVQGSTEFIVGLAGAEEAAIDVLRSDDPNLLVVSLLGPALILALALLGIWCLHASAVMIEGEATVFVGESGAGKSTLAAALASRGSGECKQIADDIVPMRVTREALVALPRFPQLKLPPEKQPATDSPESLPVSGIFLIDARSTQDPGTLSPLSLRKSTVALLSHTPSARLFGRQLLADHLTFCSQAAMRASPRRLAYTHTLGGLQAASSALEEGHGTTAVRFAPNHG